MRFTGALLVMTLLSALSFFPDRGEAKLSSARLIAGDQDEPFAVQLEDAPGNSAAAGAPDAGTQSDPRTDALFEIPTVDPLREIPRPSTIGQSGTER